MFVVALNDYTLSCTEEAPDVLPHPDRIYRKDGQLKITQSATRFIRPIKIGCVFFTVPNNTINEISKMVEELFSRLRWDVDITVADEEIVTVLAVKIQKQDFYQGDLEDFEIVDAMKAIKSKLSKQGACTFGPKEFNDKYPDYFKAAVPVQYDPRLSQEFWDSIFRRS